MNAIGLVQSKWLPNFAQGPLRSYFDEKWNSSLISIICFTSFLFIICDIFILILQISGEEMFQSAVFGYYVQQPSLWHDVKSASQLLHLSIHRLRVTSRERVSFMRIWTSSVQNSLSKEIVVECKY